MATTPISTFGHIAGQTRFHVYQGLTQADIASGVPTKIVNLTNLLYDKTGEWDIATDSWVVRNSGIYMVGFCTSASPITGGYHESQIWVNGAEYYAYPAVVSGTTLSQSGDLITMELAKDDEVELYIEENDGVVSTFNTGLPQWCTYLQVFKME